MKGILIVLILLLYTSILPQTPVGTFSLGAGIHYPRYLSITTGSISEHSNYGAFLSLQRKMSQHLNLRLSAVYDHLESSYNRNLSLHKLDMVSGNADVLYDVFPCEVFSPYVSAGFGVTNFTSKNASSALLNKNSWGYQMNIGIGLEYKFSDALSLKSEAVYRTSSDNKIDGSMSVNDKKGLFRTNGDTYVTMDLGLLWNFSLGPDYGYCDALPGGIKEIYVTDTLITEVPVIKEKVDTVYVERPVLFMVNFDFDKSDLNPEAIPILEHTVSVLQNYKDLKIKISGHTDNEGTDEYNSLLSEKRARKVYDYLILNGISKDRLSIAYYGERFSIRDNDSDTGRAFNRRVEFQIEEQTYTSR